MFIYEFVYYIFLNVDSLDATFSGGSGRKVNDAPKPLANCQPIIVKLGDVPHVCLFATRNVGIGEELRYDYGVTNLPWRKKASG